MFKRISTLADRARTQDVGSQISNVLRQETTPASIILASLPSRNPRPTSITSSATPSINVDDYDALSITALAANITSLTVSGTPVNFHRFTLRIKDDGTARTLAFGSSFVDVGIDLPTTTVAGKLLLLEWEYDTVTSKWGLIRLISEATALGTIYTQALDADNDGYNGITIVQAFPVTALTLPSGAITQVRFTFRAGSTQAMTITDAYVGHGTGSGDAYDFAATPTQLLFSGGASKVVASGTEEPCDLTDFSYNKSDNLLVAVYCGGGAGSDMWRMKSGLSYVSNYQKTANEAATVNKSGYATNSGYNVGITKIETNGF